MNPYPVTGIGLDVGVGVLVGVFVVVEVGVGVEVLFGVLVTEGVGVTVFVGVLVGVAVFVGVLVGVAVFVGVGVGVLGSIGMFKLELQGEFDSTVISVAIESHCVVYPDSNSFAVTFVAITPDTLSDMVNRVASDPIDVTVISIVCNDIFFIIYKYFMVLSLQYHHLMYNLLLLQYHHLTYNLMWG